MIPVLYSPNAIDFTSFGLGALTDTISCEVTEERNGVFECLLKYQVSGQHYELITKECIIKAKPNAAAADQAFRIYRITKPLKGIVSIYGQHISYDLAVFNDHTRFLPSVGVKLHREVIPLEFTMPLR